MDTESFPVAVIPTIDGTAGIRLQALRSTAIVEVDLQAWRDGARDSTLIARLAYHLGAHLGFTTLSSTVVASAIE